jgi:hypothetical protein
MVAAIATCRAPASVLTDGERAMVHLKERRTEAAFNCLSRWVHDHPEAGFEQVGFVGSEQ